MVYTFGERDVVSYIIWRSKHGVSETQLKPCCRIVVRVCNALDFVSDSDSDGWC